MRNLVIFALVFGLNACKNSSFSGGNRKKKPNQSENTDRNEGLGKGESGRSEGAPPGAQTSAQPYCLPERPPSAGPLGLTEVFNWVAEGPQAAYNQVMAAPMVGVLKQLSKNPAIVVPAFNGMLPDSYWSGGAYLYAIDGKTGSQLAISDDKYIPSATVAIGDVDNDGENDVVGITLEGGVNVLDSALNVKETLPLSVFAKDYRFFGGPLIVDLEQDGTPEIVVGNTVQTYKGSGYTLKATASEEGPWTSIVADTDLSGDFEVVTNYAIFKGKQKLCTFDQPMTSLAAAKLTLGNNDMTVIGRAYSGEVVGVSGSTCKPVLTIPKGDVGGGAINIADYDGDGNLDFGIARKNSYTAYDSKGKQLWKNTSKDVSSSQTGATTFDFNGDGKNEIAYNDEVYLRIYDGQTGKTLYQIANSTGTLFEFPVVADLVGDGHASLIVASNNYAFGTNKGVRVFRDPDNKWVNTRKIWNQYGYQADLVGEGGKVTNLKANFLYGYLAGFRNNVPLIEKPISCPK
jgi:hypothetical protein